MVCCKGKFYSKDRDTKGMTILYFVSIVVIVVGIFTRSIGVASLGVVCFILNYIYYAEELALYEQKDVLLPNIVYIAIRFMIAFVIFLSLSYFLNLNYGIGFSLQEHSLKWLEIFYSKDLYGIIVY